MATFVLLATPLFRRSRRLLPCSMRRSCREIVFYAMHSSERTYMHGLLPNDGDLFSTEKRRR